MKTKNLILLAAVALMGTMQSCKTDPVVAEPSTSSTDLISLLATGAISADASIDASWANCNKLSTNTVEVPDTTLFGKIYTLFLGKTENFTVRSQYDANNIYFLVELADLTQSTDNRAWYFDAKTKLWTRPASITDTTKVGQFGQDQFAMLFPITDNAAWNKSTCLSTCHYGVTPKYGNHYTAKFKDASDVMTGFTADVWFWRSAGSQANNQTADAYITTDSVATSAGSVVVTTKAVKGGRVGADAVSTAYALGTSNTQNLIPTGGTKAIAVPKYVMTGVAFIKQSDVTSKAAKLVTAVDANGVLTLEDATKIDPTTTTDYSFLGSKKITYALNGGPLLDSNGDITSYSTYVSGKGWVIKVIRKLATTDKTYDAQFDIAKTYMFGFATFDNANNQHLIKTNLKLSFATVAAK
ncbi:MAG: ethylbenzene dehydrogenase-related protein [Paludibacter sp.]